ncbi:MAG TPA: Dabb family protein [Acidimicrobiales bacterium]|nr:Dabb family protein [Acidimicrobiales bacterium]
MLRHVVLFTWKPGAPKAQIGAFAEGLAELPDQIKDIRSLRFGPDARLGGGNEDFALVVDFADAEGYRRYAEHPAHRHLIATLLVPLLGTRHAVQFTI